MKATNPKEFWVQGYKPLGNQRPADICSSTGNAANKSED